MKRASTDSPPILKSESNLNTLDEDQHSSPPKLMAIVNKSKRGSPKPSRPPELKAKPVSEINNRDKISLSVLTPNCKGSTSSRENSSPPILEARPVFEKKEEHNLSANCKPPKLKVKPTQIQKESNSELEPNQPPPNVLVEPVSPNSRERVKVSETSPGPPKLSPIFEKPKSKSQDDRLVLSLKETAMLIEGDVSESSLEPPKLTTVKKTRGKEREKGSHKSSQPPILRQVVPVLEVTEEDQTSIPSPGPPNLTSIFIKSKKRSQKSSQPSEKAVAILPEKNQQISVPSTAAPKLKPSVKKSKSSHKSSRPPILQETTLISKVSEEVVSMPSIIHLKPKSRSKEVVKRKSSKSSQPSTLEVITTISPTSVLPEVQASTTPTPSQTKTIHQKRKSSTPSPLPTIKTESTSEGVQRSTSASPKPCIDFSLSFSGIISHKASLLEKGFEASIF